MYGKITYVREITNVLCMYAQAMTVINTIVLFTCMSAGTLFGNKNVRITNVTNTHTITGQPSCFRHSS